jgi:hypothetical protein
MSERDGHLAAIDRYLVISGYLALDPPRGKRKTLREQLAGKT